MKIDEICSIEYGLVKWILPFYLPHRFVNVFPLLLTTQITLSFKFQDAQYMEANENFAMGNSSHEPKVLYHLTSRGFHTYHMQTMTYHGS
jgi:hypothetical protein